MPTENSGKYSRCIAACCDLRAPPSSDAQRGRVLLRSTAPPQPVSQPVFADHEAVNLAVDDSGHPWKITTPVQPHAPHRTIKCKGVAQVRATHRPPTLYANESQTGSEGRPCDLAKRSRAPTDHYCPIGSRGEGQHPRWRRIDLHPSVLLAAKDPLKRSRDSPPADQGQRV